MGTLAERADKMERICCATTDNTSMLMRLNSSKQPQAPVCDSPEYIRPIDLKSNPSEQLITMTYIPSAFPKSFVVSVLPVPAGPFGDPPRWRSRAVVKVI